MTNNLDARPLPAPLPYSSRAGRGEIPAASPAAIAADRDHHDPNAPLLREDEVTLLACGAFVFGFMLLIGVIALAGGL